jgi:hypothetical protein
LTVVVLLRFGFPSILLQIIQAIAGNQLLPELHRDVGIVIAEHHQSGSASEAARDLIVHRGRFNDQSDLIEAECRC